MENNNVLAKPEGRLSLSVIRLPADRVSPEALAVAQAASAQAGYPWAWDWALGVHFSSQFSLLISYHQFSEK